jgi:galactose mutarotase-like enzyme
MRIGSEASRITINPAGGYVGSWQVKNAAGDWVDVLYQGQTQKRSGIPLLFPYFGLAEGMRTHGFGRDSTWRCAADGTTATLRLNSGDIDETARQEYPHAFAATVIIQIEADGSLLYHLHVDNTGEQELPLSPGLHPYWAVDHSAKPRINISGIAGFDAASIDWTNAPPDDGFGYGGKVSVELPGKTITIEDVTAGGTVVSNMVVWSQSPQADDYNFVCVEPVCGLANAVHEHPILVAPGGEFDMQIRFGVFFA